MLIELSIRDIALIPRLRLRFGPGLHVVSGETGAGKSLVVGSLRLLCGEKTSPDVVRAGSDRGIVEAVFEVPTGDWLARELAEAGVEPEDGELILRREIAATGRGRARINGLTVPVGTLGRVAELLVDLHGQHDHQSLLRPAFQRDVLDDYAGVGEARTAFAGALGRWRSLTAEVERLESHSREADARAELARFQLRELEDAAPVPGEPEERRTELRRLESAEWLATTASRILDRLDEGEGAIGDAAGETAAWAARAAERDPEWAEVARGLDSLAISSRELASDVRGLAERAVTDPERLEETRSRLRLLEDLLRKYGPDEDTLHETWARLREEGADPEAFARRRAELAAERDREAAALVDAGGRITRARRKAAARLRREVEKTLAELGMKGTRFEVAVEPRVAGAAIRGEASPERAGPSGLDQVEFRLAANRGEDLKPLRSVASGGEISRVMLALKSSLGSTRGTATMVFDEIDAGVGGRVGGKVGELLANLAKERQVLCITHLASIACRADVHLRVEKEEEGDRTVTRVEPVADDERVREIARMLGGDEQGAALDHARRLLSGTA